jgi:hypothetical protein
MKSFTKAICIVLMSISSVGFLTGCIEDTQSTLSSEVNNLIDSDASGWIYSNGYVTYALSNGTIRVKFDGSIDLIVQHETGPSVIYVSSYDRRRAQIIAKKFGVSKMTPEDLGRSTDVKEGLLFIAISEITNIVAKTNPTIYEEEE